MIVGSATYASLQAPGAGDSITPVFLLMVFVVAPILAIRAYYRLRSGEPLPNKEKRLLGIISGQTILLLPALASAKRQGLKLWPMAFPTPRQWLVGALLVCLFVISVYRAWQRNPRATADRARLFMPENVPQLRYCVVVSLIAGVGEEYAYRGVAYAAIFSLTGWSYSAALVCAIAFGAAHLHHGLRNGVWTSLVGLVLQILVLWTGTLYLSIAVHAVYDLLVGIISMRFLEKDRANQLPATQPAS